MFSNLKYSNSVEELDSFKDTPYKCYFAGKGSPIEKVLEEGRIPLSTAGLMERRLEVMNDSYTKDIKNFWWETSFETSDGIFYKPLHYKNGAGGPHNPDCIKIVRHSKQIITQQLFNNNWLFPTDHWPEALEEGEKIYQSLNGVEIKSDELYDLINEQLIINGKLKKTALSNKILLFLADNDSSLLERYLKTVEKNYPIYDEDNFEFNFRMGNFGILVEDRRGYCGNNIHMGRRWKLHSLGMWGSAFNGSGFERGDFLVGILPEKADKYNNRDAHPETIKKIRSFLI